MNFETKLYDLWIYYAKTRKTLFWQGHHLLIKDCGKLNTSEGPDFSGVLFHLDGTEYSGQVEIHRYTDDWYKHGHHRDKNYANVLLHVVSANCPNPKPVETIYGRIIPVFVLYENQGDNLNAVFTIPFLKKYKKINNLKNLARDRLQIKSTFFQNQFSHYGLKQVLLSGLMRSMGYPNNKSAFELLSYKIPTHYFKYPYQQEFLLAYLAGLSGFLNNTFNDNYVIKIRKYYLDMKPSLVFSEMACNNWQFSGIRPRNHPHFRLAALCYFLLQKGTINQFFDFLWDLFSSRPTFEKLHKDLNQLFTVEAKDYWKTHYAFDKNLKTEINKKMIGLQRITEILINIIIPSLCAWAIKTGSIGFKTYLEEFYLFIPDPGIKYFKIRKKIPWSFTHQQIWPKAAYWQALLQLESTCG